MTTVTCDEEESLQVSRSPSQAGWHRDELRLWKEMYGHNTRRRQYYSIFSFQGHSALLELQKSNCPAPETRLCFSVVLFQKN
jgi:hypothetical protein